LRRQDVATTESGAWSGADRTMRRVRNRLAN